MTNICNFCLKLSNGCRSVDERLKANIELVFVNVEFAIADCSQICQECIQRVNSAFDLKTASICHEDLIVSHKSNKPRHEKLIEVYLEKNKIKCDNFLKDLKVCRVCISVVAENNFHLLNDIEVDSIAGVTLRTQFCEIDFSITNIPIVCKECLIKLHGYGMFINSWLDIYHLKKSYCHVNKKIDISDLNEVRQFILENNIDGQYSYILDIDICNSEKETFTKLELESEDDHNEENRDGVVNIIQVKDDIEINEWKYLVEGFEIKTESVSHDSQLHNNVLSSIDDFGIEESRQETEALHFEPKLELDEYVLKEEDISIIDATYDSTQKSTESSSSKREVVPTEASTSSTFSSILFTESPPKKKKDRNLKKSIKQLYSSNNNPYQRIEINDGFRCGLCSFQNQLEASVKEHFKKYHYSKYNYFNLSELPKKNVNKMYKCEHCDDKSQCKECLKSHLIVHSNESQIHKCEHCDFKTKYKRSLKRHLSMHSSEFNIFKCEHCDFKTKYKHNLKLHLMIHSNQSKIYECEHCDYNTKYKDYLKSHSMLHSNESNIYKCEHCDYKTIYKNYIKRHFLVHSSEYKIHKCAHCDYETKYKGTLKTHLIVHSNEYKTHKCPHCDYKTKYKGTLKTHLIVHSNEYKIHKCYHCDYKTKYKNSLKSHLIVHSDQSQIYECAHCDYKTKHKLYLKRHLNGHSSESDMFKCERCDFKTYYKRSLKLHSRVHSNESKIYECEQCDYNTKYKGNLKSHLMVHFKPKMYEL